MMNILLSSFLTFTGTAYSGTTMPFTLEQKAPVSGEYRSSDFPGAVFVIEAYFNNCPYCNQNSRFVNELASKYKGNSKVQVLDVSIDNVQGSYEAWVRNNRPNHPVLDDHRRHLLFGELGATSFPTTYVINSQGKLLYKHTGVWRSVEEVSSVVDSALKLLEGEEND